MKVLFRTKSKENPTSLYIRIYHSKDFDIWSKTGFYVNGKYWSNKKENISTANSNHQQREFINKELPQLKDFIINNYNNEVKRGKQIDKLWVEKLILQYNNQPKDHLSEHEVYLVPFIEKYINESYTRINSVTGRSISNKTIQKYITTKKRLKEFEEEKFIRLKHIDIDLKFHQEFISFLKFKKSYGLNTVGKYITNIKSFIREARSEGYVTSPQVESSKFNAPKEKPIHIYLNEKEIDHIFHKRFKSERLNNTRQLMIIGIWTGLRISDLSRIHDFDFSNNIIQITDTIKTNDFIRIPIHPQVRKILIENKGNLPRVISDVKFNKYIKEVCKEVGITSKTMGSKKDPETNRIKKDYYQKWELVTSHTFRRSFATNHYGKLPNHVIMSITKHKSENQFLQYVKSTSEDHFNQLKEYWQQNSNNE